MEDISRDLEREIANARPKLPKKSKKQKILILSPDGKIRSGWYLRFCNRVLLILAAIALTSCIVLYFMYNAIQTKNLHIIQELDHMGDTYQDLLHERETLMARLFLLQKDMARTPSKKQKSKPTTPPKEKSTWETVPETPQVSSGENSENSLPSAKPSAPAIVTVQKFSIEKAPEDESGVKKIIVKFNIRNVSKNVGDVSGWLFAAIKPRQGTDQDWLISPKSSIKDGVPVTPEKGLSFSIARFRPVKLMLETEKEIDFFHEAVVFVFDKKGTLITQSVFGIDQTTITGN